MEVYLPRYSLEVAINAINFKRHIYLDMLDHDKNLTMEEIESLVNEEKELTRIAKLIAKKIRLNNNNK